MTKTLAELAEHVGGKVFGDPDCQISSIGTLANGGPGQIAFLSNRRYRKQLECTAASAVIISLQDVEKYSGNAIIVSEPYVAYAKIVLFLYGNEQTVPGREQGVLVHADAEVDATCRIGANTVVESGAQIGAGVEIGAGCYIGKNVLIGQDSRLYPNVTICADCVIGDRAILHPGVVIGSDGFGLANDNGRWIKVKQVGKVVLGDDVEIGANTTIDRGAIEDTILEDGVKLDNLVQVAHNVRIGAHTAIAACAGISGSAKIGRHCAIGGGVGILGHLEIADNTTVTAMSLVTGSIATPGVYSSGTPLEENRKWHRNFVRAKQLDEFARRIKYLEKMIKEQSE